MGSQTAHGFPYPVGTDRVMDGDDAIKALADATDTRVGDSRVALMIPGTGSSNTPASGTAVWGAMGNVDIPVWAKRARVMFAVCVYTAPATAVNANAFVRFVGAAANADTGVIRIPGSAQVQAHSMVGASIADVSAIAGQSARPVQVMAAFNAGGGQFTNAQLFAVIIDWLP